MAKKPPESFEIFDGKLIFRDEQRRYWEVLRVHLIAANGASTSVIYRVVDGHLLLGTGHAKRMHVFTVQKIPASKRLPGLRIPTEFETFEIRDKAPYVVKAKQPSR